MGIIHRLGPAACGIGAEIADSYIRIVYKGYDAVNDRWLFNIRYYLNKESRDFERASEYLLNTYSDINAIPNKEDYTKEQMDSLAYLFSLRGDAHTVMRIDWERAGAAFAQTNAKDKAGILAEAYKLYKEQHQAVAITDILDDEPVENVLSSILGK